MRVPGSNWQIGAAVALTLALASWPGEVPQAAEDPLAPMASIARLKAGNARFVADPERPLPISSAQRTALVGGQRPFAAVLSCADSRVPPEVVFHTGLGDLFVVRAAGHVPDRSVVASLEYAAEHLRVPVIVVMGHESCGAVQAAVDTPVTKSLGPNLDFMLKAIRPAVAATAATPEAGRVRAAILRNVEESVNEVIADSAILRHLAENGSLGLVGAYYELASGRVHFSEPASIGPVNSSSRPPQDSAH
jgi:carbonic anhydrase